VLTPVKDYLPFILISSVRNLPPSARKRELMRMYELGLLTPDEMEVAIKAYRIEGA